MYNHRVLYQSIILLTCYDYNKVTKMYINVYFSSNSLSYRIVVCFLSSVSSCIQARVGFMHRLLYDEHCLVSAVRVTLILQCG